MDKIGGIPDDYIPEEPFNIYFEEDGRPTLQKQYIFTPKKDSTEPSEPETISTPPIPEPKTAATPESEKIKEQAEIANKKDTTDIGDLKSALNMMHGALKDNLRKTVDELKEATSEVAEKKGGLFGRLFGKRK